MVHLVMTIAVKCDLTTQPLWEGPAALIADMAALLLIHLYFMEMPQCSKTK